MTFTEKIEKLLAANHIQEVIDEFFKFLSEVPQSKKDARSDANQLRGQIIVLSGRFTELSSKINTNTVNADAANQEKAALINSFIHIMNQLPSNYPDLNNYVEEKNEDDEWNDAQKKNSIEAYQAYFYKYPNGKYKADTIKLIAELEEVKQKQDNEIKRLALLEKERRENDKLVGEPKKVQAVGAGQPIHQSSGTENSTSPAKSKKGLLIVLGVVIIAAVVIFLMTGKKEISAEANKENVDTLSSKSVKPPADPYTIDSRIYYFIENRDSGKILAVLNSSQADDAELIVTDTADKMNKKFEKFYMVPSTGSGKYIIYAAHSGKVLEYRTISSINLQVLRQFALSEDPHLQIFLFKPSSDGYFIISAISDEGGKVLGLDPDTRDDPEGQNIIGKDDDRSPQTQWKLVPTGEEIEK